MNVCCVCNKPTNSIHESLIQCSECKFYVHKECYGFHSQVPVVDYWTCQRCQLGNGNERCELCPFSDGALKKTDNGKWAHILCAQYIPEVIFGDNYSMEPINLAEVPRPRFQQVCYICDERGEHIAKRQGACMQCNVQNCVNCFHVTCGQRANLLVAEDCDNRRIVDYYGFCSLHVKSNKVNKASDSRVKHPMDKLPSVETLSSSKVRDAGKVVSGLNNAPVLSADPPSIKPMQPKVSSSPIPFEGVHKQTRIPIVGEQQENSAEREVRAQDLESTASNTSTAPSGSYSPSTLDARKRKSSSSTETAESEETSNEPVVTSLRDMVNSSVDKTKLKISRQSDKIPQGSSDHDYNDLSDVFSKKMKKKKKYKSPDSDNSDYVPYNERKVNPLYKKGKRARPKKEVFKIRTKTGFKSKSPKFLANSYLYKSPPKTPVKVEGSKLLTGDKCYSPTTVITKMMKETKSESTEGYKPCTGKPLISVDTFFERFREMGMQHIINNCRSSKSVEMLKELQSINQINSHLRHQLKAKQNRIDHLKKLNARLSVPYTKPMKSLPDAAPISQAVAKLLTTIHQPPVYRKDRILAETWLDEKTVKEAYEKKDQEVENNKEAEKEDEQEVEKLKPPASMSALLSKELPSAPRNAPTESDGNKPPADPGSSTTAPLPAKGQIPSAASEQPQVIIAGDPPMAYTYKDGNIVGYPPEALQASAYSKGYSKALEEQYKLLEQHYKEKISAAYFEAQCRQYEGLLQHQLQTKLQSNDYLTQAYLTDSHWSNYLYAQQAAASSSGRQQLGSALPYPPTTLPSTYSPIPPNRPPTSRH